MLRIRVRLHEGDKAFFVEERVRTSWWKFWERIWITRGRFGTYLEAYEYKNDYEFERDYGHD